MFGHISLQNRVGVLVAAARLFEEALLCARTLEVGVGRVQVPEGGQDKVLGIGHGVRDGTVQDVLAGVPSTLPQTTFPRSLSWETRHWD